MKLWTRGLIELTYLRLGLEPGHLELVRGMGVGVAGGGTRLTVPLKYIKERAQVSIRPRKHKPGIAPSPAHVSAAGAECPEGQYKKKSADKKTPSCEKCDAECLLSCSGPGPAQCAQCRHARLGQRCVAACPRASYTTAEGECRDCHASCEGGCRGPANTLGPRGCNSCAFALVSAELEVVRCLQLTESCPDGYFYEWVGAAAGGRLAALAGKAVCRPCHPLCRQCLGYGLQEGVCLCSVEGAVKSTELVHSEGWGVAGGVAGAGLLAAVLLGGLLLGARSRGGSWRWLGLSWRGQSEDTEAVVEDMAAETEEAL